MLVQLISTNSNNKNTNNIEVDTWQVYVGKVPQDYYNFTGSFLATLMKKRGQRLLRTYIGQRVLTKENSSTLDKFTRAVTEPHTRL